MYRLINKAAIQILNNNLLNKNDFTSNPSYQIFNIGNSQEIKVMDFVEELERSLNLKAKKKFLKMQLGDVKSTFADCSKLERFFNFKPNTSLKNGISKFVNWYREY